MSKTVLIIDDEESIRITLAEALKDEGFRVQSAASGEEGIESIQKDLPDVVLLDIWMPKMDGMTALKEIKLTFPNVVVIMMSGHGNIETAVKATKLGAFDFVEKPLNLERILLLLQNASSAQDLARENQALRKQVEKQKTIIGESESIHQIKEILRRVAPTSSSVLITGENGTGKELVAHSVHALSQRFNKAFIEVNCAAIPEELIESDLFGHEKGSFTGATQMRRGKFDLANNGTLFLDEIGDMSLKTQAKILRIIQEQKFERVGGAQTISVDVRIVAATNKDLKQEISEGKFREDLYYRLNVIRLHVPPLRDRKSDIPILVKHFLREFFTVHGKNERPFSEEAMKVATDYPWPGNVRELKNLVERIIILSTDAEAQLPVSAANVLESLNDSFGFGNLSEIAPDVNLESNNTSSLSKNLRDARAEFEKEYILKTLKEHDWNISKTALILGVERSHLHKKIKSFGIETA